MDRLNPLDPGGITESPCRKCPNDAEIQTWIAAAPKGGPLRDRIPWCREHCELGRRAYRVDREDRTHYHLPGDLPADIRGLPFKEGITEYVRRYPETRIKTLEELFRVDYKRIRAALPYYRTRDSRTGRIPLETERAILAELAAGVRETKLREKYGIGGSTMIRIKRQHGLMPIEEASK